MNQPIGEHSASILGRDKLIETGGFRPEEESRSVDKSAYGIIDNFSNYSGAISVNEFV